MSRIISVLIQNSLHQNKNIEEVTIFEIRYLPDISIFNLPSVFVLVQKLLNYYPNYPTHRLYFGEVETPYRVGGSSYNTSGVLNVKMKAQDNALC